LNAYINVKQTRGLSASIGAHDPGNLTARLKGWVREAVSDLTANIKGYTYEGLGAIIRSTYIGNLTAQVFGVAPINLSANIYGWDLLDLPALINGVRLDTDLLASITGTGWRKDLPVYISGVTATGVSYDLGARISSWYTGNLNARINSVHPSDLGATVVVDGGALDLGASIYPKMIRLTTIISFITMENHDMSATINICMGSEMRNLSSYLRAVYKSDLSATINGIWNQGGSSNLGASIGRENKYYAIDKLPISVYISFGDYWTEDKLPISFRVSNGLRSLGATITGIHASSDLTASLNAVLLDPYGFENDKNRERVYTLNKMGEKLKFEVAEISFKSVVSDYFYVSADDTAYKTNRLERWVTNVSSYIPKNTRLNIKRRFHRMTSLHDISKFSSLDAAMKFAIDYVTAYPEVDLGAYINVSGKYTGLGATIMPKFTSSESNNLTTTIVGTT
jgi:hypothetical protein